MPKKEPTKETKSVDQQLLELFKKENSTCKRCKKELNSFFECWAQDFVTDEECSRDDDGHPSMEEPLLCKRGGLPCSQLDFFIVVARFVDKVITEALKSYGKHIEHLRKKEVDGTVQQEEEEEEDYDFDDDIDEEV